MKIEGQHLFAATPELVWDAVTDPAVLAKVLPGCEDFHAARRAGGRRPRVRRQAEDQGGPGAGRLPGQRGADGSAAAAFLPAQAQRQRRAGLRRRRRPAASSGPDPSGGTLLRYSVDAKIGGRIATVGQRLLDSSSKVITRQALEGLEGQVGARIAVARRRRRRRSRGRGRPAGGRRPPPRPRRTPPGRPRPRPTPPPAKPKPGRRADGRRRRGRGPPRPPPPPKPPPPRARSPPPPKQPRPSWPARRPPRRPSQSELAAKVAKGVADDLIPVPRAGHPADRRPGRPGFRGPRLLLTAFPPVSVRPLRRSGFQIGGQMGHQITLEVNGE